MIDKDGRYSYTRVTADELAAVCRSSTTLLRIHRPDLEDLYARMNGLAHWCRANDQPANCELLTDMARGLDLLLRAGPDVLADLTKERAAVLTRKDKTPSWTSKNL
jgi:hypothetical protein